MHAMSPPSAQGMISMRHKYRKTSLVDGFRLHRRRGGSAGCAGARGPSGRCGQRTAGSGLHRPQQAPLSLSAQLMRRHAAELYIG